ncbi:MAG: hypothetical protein WKG07_09425 [Hymenobacter sp.]
MNRNRESIRLLEAALKTKPALLPAAQLTARLQLTFHYFAEGQFSKANHTLIQPRPHRLLAGAKHGLRVAAEPQHRRAAHPAGIGKPRRGAGAPAGH